MKKDQLNPRPLHEDPQGAPPRLGPDYAGLSLEEADRLREQGRQNIPPKSNSRSALRILADNIFTYFNFLNLLLALLILYASLHNPRYFSNLLFFGVVIANTFIGSFQELRAKRSIDRLKLQSESKALVLRGGQRVEIPDSELLPGDRLFLREGQRLSVDGYVLDSEGLEMDESQLTGESRPCRKAAGDDVFSGSFVKAGRGSLYVQLVSTETLAAKLMHSARQEKRQLTPLMRSLNQLLRLISIVLFPLGLLLLLKQIFWLRAGDLPSAIISSSALLLSMIPEGLVLLASLAFAVSVVKLARQRCLVPRLTAIESLARVDCLCLDKTGTITTGQLLLEAVLDAGQLEEVSAAPERLKQEGQTLRPWAPEHCSAELRQQLLAFCQIFPEGNATQSALNRQFRAQLPEKTAAPLEIYPFSSERKWSGYQAEQGDAYFLGAADYLLQPAERLRAEDLLRTLASQGLRLLVFSHSAVAARERAEGQYQLPEERQTLALLLFRDQIRPDAAQTLAYFREQGVEIKIISGDNPRTVAAIAEAVDLSCPEDSLYDMSQIPEGQDLQDIAQKGRCFGRVSPFQKQALLSALQAQGHCVAMTGDGVNDVPALKQADCGVAMSQGSDAARGAADIVLLDDRFSAMPEAVYEGRRVVNNIQRVASLFLVKTTYATLFALLALLLPITYPLYPIQASLISSATVGIPAFFLALKPNRERIRGSFLANVLPTALPAGIAACLSLLFLQVYHILWPMTLTHLRSASFLCLLTIGLRCLYSASKPFDHWRRLLFLGCLSLPILALLLFPQVFFFRLDGSTIWLILPYLLFLLGLTQVCYLLFRSRLLRRSLRRTLGASASDIVEEERQHKLRRRRHKEG